MIIHKLAVIDSKSYTIDHWSAMAFAIQGKVFDLLFHQGIHINSLKVFQLEVVLKFPFHTIFVCFNSGRFFNHKQVVFCASSQNCQGCIIWSGFLHFVLIIHTGFSIAILSIGAFASFIKKSILFCWLQSAIFRAKCLDQDTAKSVHGGWAIIMSYFPL